MNNTTIKILGLLPLLLCPFSTVHAASATDTDPAPPGLSLTLSAPQSSYVQGEPIEVTARYVNTGTQPLTVEVFPLERALVINEFTVRAGDAQGRSAPDPLPSPGVTEIDRMSTSRPLTAAQPYAQTFILNEWVWFPRPGRYTVTATSRLVSQSDGPLFHGKVMTVSSGPLTLDIQPPDPRQRRQDLIHAEADFRHGTPVAGIAAIRKARFWNDPAAIPLLVEALAREGTAEDAELGLETLLDIAPASVKAAVQSAFDNPSRLIEPRDIWGYVGVLAATDAPRQPPGSKNYMTVFERLYGRYGQRLAAALPHLPTAQAVNFTVDGLASGPMLSWNDPANWRRVLRHVRLIDSSRRFSAVAVIRDDCRLRSVIPDLKRMLASTSGPAESVSLSDYRDAARAALRAMGQR